MKFFEDVAVGETVELGSWTFTAEGIRAFAGLWDPQPFHLDEAAGAASHFGGLVASGWHVAAIWMKLMVAYQERVAAAERVAGQVPAELGPSPGFRDMRWLRPVRAGDTLTYVWEATGKRTSASRPGWGIVEMRNHARDGDGTPVFRFDGVVFWPRRRAE